MVEPVPLAPRRLYVSWKYPASWPKEPHFQLRFRLQYRPVIHRSWSVVSGGRGGARRGVPGLGWWLQVLGLPTCPTSPAAQVETVNLSEVITDAFAGLEHVVQVSAKDFLDAGNWSEWSAEARATPVRGAGQGSSRLAPTLPQPLQPLPHVTSLPRVSPGQDPAPGVPSRCPAPPKNWPPVGR